MTKAMQILFDEARKLSPVEREELAERLLDTLPLDPIKQSELDRTWGEEVDRRWQAHIATGQPAIDAFEALEDARKQLRQSK